MEAVESFHFQWSNSFSFILHTNLVPGIGNNFRVFWEEIGFPAHNGILLFPNPVSEILHIEANEKIKAICIFDESGKIVRKFYGNDTSINVKDLNVGVYIITLGTYHGILHSNFIKK